MKRKLVLITILLGIIGLPLYYAHDAYSQLQTVRSILNNVWDRANSRLMATPWAGAQGAFETETAIWNNVWDKTTNSLRINGGSASSGSSTDISGLLSGDGATLSGIANVAAGQVLTSGTPAAWSASPSVTSMTTVAPTASLGSEIALALVAGNYSVGTGWESPIAGGVLNKNANGTGAVTMSPQPTQVVGAIYRVQITFSAFTAGTASYDFGGTAGNPVFSSAGTYTHYLTARTTAGLAIQGSNTSRFTISALSIRRWDQNTGTESIDGLATFNGGLKVKGGGIAVGNNIAPTAAGMYIQWDAGPGIVMDGQLQDSAGTLTQASVPQIVLKASPLNTTVGGIFSGGYFTSVNAVLISGDFHATWSNGTYTVTNGGGSALPNMLEVKPDVANGIVIRPYNTSNAIVITDDSSTITAGFARNLEIGADGRLFYGAPGNSNLTTGRPVAKLTLTAAGTSCNTTAPSCTITASDGNGSGAACTATASGGAIQTLSLTIGGSGYTANPTVAFGNSCTGTATAALADVCMGRGSAGELILGCGESTAVPVGNVFRAPTATGTDIAGADLALKGGLPTGAGAIGKITLGAATTVGGSGTTVNTNTTHMTIGGGAAVVNVTTDATTDTTGAMQVLGGMSVAKRTFLKSLTTDAGATDATLCRDTTSHEVLTGTGTIGICLGTSSARFKHDIAHLALDGISAVQSLQPRTYYYNPGVMDPYGTKLLYGFTAEEVVGVLPQLVGLDKDGQPNTVDMLGMVPVLVKALQQQQTQIEDLQREVARLAR